MTGRLDQVDLPTDLTLLVIHDALDREPPGIEPAELEERLRSIETDPFPFDTVLGDHDLGDHLGMFARIGFIEVTEEPRIILTQPGVIMAEHLLDVIDDGRSGFLGKE